MEEMDTRNSGFGLVAVLIVIVAIVVIGVVGGVVYKHDHKTAPVETSTLKSSTSSQSKKQTSTTTQGSSSQSSNSSSTTNTNTFNIPELNATMTLPSGLSASDLKYVITTNTGTQVANFTTTSLETADGSNNCNGSNGGIGSIWETTQSPASGADASKQIGQYYYNFEQPASPCSGNSSAEQLELTQTAELKQAFETITTN
jgi:Tfp pilus assembly major pilin PilA